MNTRLQVEHPVTELVTGLDLVEQQLRIAEGRPIEIAQSEVDGRLRSGGHAVEVRLYAEDAEDGFLPATGRVERLRWPAGPGIRIDAGIDEGSLVGSRFDPMLAKVIAHGADRGRGARPPDPRARRDRRSRADDEPALPALAGPRTGGARRPDAHRHAGPDLAAGGLGGAGEGPRGSLAGGGAGAGGRRLAGRLAAQGRTTHPACDRGRGANGRARWGVAGGRQRRRALDLALVGDIAFVDVAGRSVPIRIAPPPDVDRAARAASAQHGGGPADVVAPMPGSILTVHVSAGAAVEAGDPIVTLEAMKMEHAVVAPVAGVVAELPARAGDQVTRGQLLAVIEP